MSFGSYSSTAANNITLGSISIRENCPPGNVNDALRQLAADGRELYDQVQGINVSGYMPVTGGAFTGNITRSGAGGFWYHANTALSSAPVYVQLASAALPTSPAEGTIVLQYS